MKKYWMTIMVMFAFVSAASAYPILDSSTWESGWEMNGAGAPAEWTAVGTITSQATWTGTSLLLAGDPAWDDYWSVSPSPLRDPSDPIDWGIEYRMRESASSPDTWNQFYLPGGNGMDGWVDPSTTKWGILQTGSAAYSGPTVYTDLTVPGGHDWTAYHKYTLVGHDNGDGTSDIAFYIDGVVQVASATYWNLGSLSNIWYLGNMDGSGKTVEYDYIRWTQVPEPVTLVLLGLGGLSALLARRRL